MPAPAAPTNASAASFTRPNSHTPQGVRRIKSAIASWIASATQTVRQRIARRLVEAA